MDKTELDRLRQLAGNETAKKLPQDESGRNMYQIRDILVESQDIKEGEPWDRRDDPKLSKIVDYVLDKLERIGKYYPLDDYEVRDELASEGIRNKNEADKWINNLLYSDLETPEKTEAQAMREWSNSIYKQYDDRGHYQEPPEGETVDLSLRRYLNADPQKVQIEEDHTEEGMLKEYKAHKKKG